MKLTINIKMAGGAFDGDEKSTKNGFEIARILHKAANSVENHCYSVGEMEIPLMDINGNKCGELKITK